METEIIIASHAERLLGEVFCREAIKPMIQAINKKRPKDNPIPLDIEVVNASKRAKSNTEIFHIASVNSISNWNGFYQTDAATGLDRCSLDNIQEKGDGLASYLIHKPTGKYRLIQSPADRDWINLWCLISACFWTAIWRSESNRFADPESRQRAARLITLREENIALAKGWGHAKKHDEDAQAVLVPVFEAFQGRVNDTFFPPYTYELPPLPDGAVLPISRVVKQIMSGV